MPIVVVGRQPLSDQPADPADGVLYILPDGATGAEWEGHPADSLLRHERGGWLPIPAPDGQLVVVLDSEEILVRRADVWTPLSFGLPEEIQQITRLGVNTTADATNVVAVRANKALWTALESESGGDGDLRFTFNKQTAGDVLSLLFQSGWGGRAELGLVGDDDFSLKVSADGGTWTRAFAVDRATGRVDFDQGATRRETTVFTANGSYVPPAWARWVEAVCVGGGAGVQAVGVQALDGGVDFFLDAAVALDEDVLRMHTSTIAQSALTRAPFPRFPDPRCPSPAAPSAPAPPDWSPARAACSGCAACAAESDSTASTAPASRVD